jgi:hypothetical protein
MLLWRGWDLKAGADFLESVSNLLCDQLHSYLMGITASFTGAKGAEASILLRAAT